MPDVAQPAGHRVAGFPARPAMRNSWACEGLDAAVTSATALERLSGGVAFLDGAGTIRWCNAAFAALRDEAPDAFIGRSVSTLHAPDDDPYGHPDALRLEDDPAAVYRFERAVAGRQLVHVLRLVSPVGAAARSYMLEVFPAAEAPLVRPGPFAEAALTADGRILVANDGFARLLGERAHRLPGRALVELVGPRDVERVQLALQAAPGRAATEDPPPIEVHLTRNDARPSWAELAVFAGPAGTLLARARDVTERKRDELLLTEVFDASPLAYALVGADGVIHSVNPAWRTQFDPLDTTGRTLAGLLGEDARPKLQRAISACAAGRSPSFELVVMVDCAARPVLARLRGTALHDLVHRMERLLVSLDDLTEHALEVEVARRTAGHARATLDELDLAVVVHDEDGRVREVNLGAHRLFGNDATDLVGHATLPAWWQPRRADGTLLAPEDHPAQRVLGDGEARADAVLGLRLGGAAPSGGAPATSGAAPLRWYLVRARALTDDTLRHRVGAVVSYSEISDLHRELTATRSECLSALDAFDSLPVAAYRTRRDLTPIRVSAALRRLARGVGERPGAASDIDLTEAASTAGSSPACAGAEVTAGVTGADGGPLGCDVFGLVHRDDRRSAADAFAQAATTRAAVRFHHRLANAHGDGRWVDHQISPVVVDGDVDGYLGVLVPVPDWVAQGDRTRRLVRLVETTNELVGEFDVEAKKVTYLNPRAMEVFDVDERRLDHLRLTALYGPEAETTFRTVVWPALSEHSQWEGELPMVTASGRRIHVQQWITAERNALGAIVRVVAVGHDVTDRSQREAELALRATHDALTGLPNRTLLLERLEAALGRARRANRLVGLAYMDLDRFKTVNDRYGHEGGDTLLVQVASRLSSVLRPTDLVARLGGDEFVVLCDGVDDGSHALAIANRVAVAVGSRPYAIGGATVRMTASVGLALSAGAEHPEALLRDADAALYRAKDSGRARIEVFDETMRSKANSRVLVAEELRASLSTGAIAVHYQPSIDLRTGDVRAVEALVRWEHPTRGLLQPSDFIEVAETTGLLAELGEQVLRHAAGRARTWEERFGAAAPAIHVNLSSRQVVDSGLLDSVQAVLSDTGLRPSLLCLELTESVLLEDSDRAIGTVRDLKALGVRLAIDDFGTGYSSLQYLSRLPVDVVKIDRSFVEDLDPARPHASVVAAAIVSLAHALGLSCIAEGVTTVTQLAELHRLGCDAAQGFYFSPPLAPQAIDSYLSNRLQPSRRREPSET